MLSICDTFYLSNNGRYFLILLAFERSFGMAAKQGFENETKREKFVRLAEARTNKIIDMVQLLGNCSNTSQYEYSQKDVDKIFKAIQSELDEAHKRFNKQESEKCSKFTLD